MIRKISHIIFSLILLVSTMGLVISKHYCGGELVSVSVYHNADSCCDMDGCCQNETHTYQVKDDFSTPVISTIPVLAELDVLGHDLLVVESLLTEPEQENTNLYVDFSPPPKTTQTVLSQKQVYLL
ncbi:MAG: hypothetical protein R2757_06805 [Draconibacterium sp.]